MIRFDLQKESRDYNYVSPCMSFISFEEESPLASSPTIGDWEDEGGEYD